MASLTDKMTLLANGFRQRFNTKDKLDIDDMIKLIALPAFPSGTNLINKPIVKDYGSNSVSFNVNTIPPAMNVPITLTFTVSSSVVSSMILSPYLTINLQDGSMKRIDSSSQTGGNYGSKVITFTIIIPAHTVIGDNNFTLKSDTSYGLNCNQIDKIVATYTGGVIKLLLVTVRATMLHPKEGVA